jgi:hypothetical protein
MGDDLRHRAWVGLNAQSKGEAGKLVADTVEKVVLQRRSKTFGL